MILASTKKVVTDMINEKKFRYEDFAITTDIGCNSKIFDYMKVSGINALHGRALPMAIGMKIGNPRLKVMTFVGDGALYAEGMAHFIHAFKYNSDMTLVVHDNQSFSLTTGQPTPTSQKGYLSKSEPMGVFDHPINPIKLALASGATFIARTNARDMEHMQEVFRKAIEHKGFSYVEVIQDCLIFNLESNNKDKRMYKIKDNRNRKTAEKLANQYDYNSKVGKIPMGIIYTVRLPTLEEKWPQLAKQLPKVKSIAKKKISKKKIKISKKAKKKK